MSYRAKYQNSSDIGVYARITNAYGLLPFSTSENFFSTFERHLGEHIPLYHCSVGGSSIIGRLLQGNSKGLLCPSITTDQELQQLRDCLPDSVKVQRVEERLTALGNVISCNDHYALVHPDLDRETVEIISDVLGVEAFPCLVAGEGLVGTYCVFTNRGGVCATQTTVEELSELANMLSVEMTAATVNAGSRAVGGGICVNDWALFCGWETTALEISNLSRIFKVENQNDTGTQDLASIDEAIIDVII